MGTVGGAGVPSSGSTESSGAKKTPSSEKGKMPSGTKITKSDEEGVLSALKGLSLGESRTHTSKDSSTPPLAHAHTARTDTPVQSVAKKVGIAPSSSSSSKTPLERLEASTNQLDGRITMDSSLIERHFVASFVRYLRDELAKATALHEKLSQLQAHGGGIAETHRAELNRLQGLADSLNNNYDSLIRKWDDSTRKIFGSLAAHASERTHVRNEWIKLMETPQLFAKATSLEDVMAIHLDKLTTKVEWAEARIEAQREKDARAAHEKSAKASPERKEEKKDSRSAPRGSSLPQTRPIHGSTPPLNPEVATALRVLPSLKGEGLFGLTGAQATAFDEMLQKYQQYNGNVTAAKGRENDLTAMFGTKIEDRKKEYQQLLIKISQDKISSLGFRSDSEQYKSITALIQFYNDVISKLPKK